MVEKNFSKWTVEELNSLLNTIGEENAREILEGNASSKNFESSDNVLFDRYGVRVPGGISSLSRSRSYIFNYHQPFGNREIDYKARLERLYKFLGVDTGITAQDFDILSRRLRRNIYKGDHSNILNNTALPIILPKLRRKDLGKEMNDYLEAARKSYLDQFPGRGFQQTCGKLEGIGIARGSRHERLLAQMRNGPVVGIYFPNALHAFSRTAQLEQMVGLTAEFILSGVDVIIAMIMYPEVLGSPKSPVSNMSALRYEVIGSNFSFYTYDSGVTFASNISPDANLNRIASGGLLLTG